jgi:hypothetical protein
MAQMLETLRIMQNSLESANLTGIRSDHANVGTV